MNTRISTNGQHAIASSNGNGASLLKPREPNERRVIQEQPQQPSAVPNHHLRPRQTPAHYRGSGNPADDEKNIQKLKTKSKSRKANITTQKAISTKSALPTGIRDQSQSGAWLSSCCSRENTF
jgi:hypothetical protein